MAIVLKGIGEHVNPIKAAATISLDAERDRVEPQLFPEMWCLHLFDQTGGLVGFFYHPNGAAMAHKAEELRSDGFREADGYQIKIARYALAAD